MNPSFGLPELPGVFTVVSYNDVDFFLLDDRTYRDSDRLVHTAAKSLYGAAQLRWLKNALLASSAGFKVIAGGSQFLSDRGAESWGNFPEEKSAFLDWTVQKSSSYVFTSGGAHGRISAARAYLFAGHFECA